MSAKEKLDAPPGGASTRDELRPLWPAKRTSFGSVVRRAMVLWVGGCGALYRLVQWVAVARPWCWLVLWVEVAALVGVGQERKWQRDRLEEHQTMDFVWVGSRNFLLGWV